MASNDSGCWGGDARQLALISPGDGLRHDRARLDGGAVVGDPVDQAMTGLAELVWCHVLDASLPCDELS